MVAQTQDRTASEISEKTAHTLSGGSGTQPAQEQPLGHTSENQHAASEINQIGIIYGNLIEIPLGDIEQALGKTMVADCGTNHPGKRLTGTDRGDRPVENGEFTVGIETVQDLLEAGRLYTKPFPEAGDSLRGTLGNKNFQPCPHQGIDRAVKSPGRPDILFLSSDHSGQI